MAMRTYGRESGVLTCGEGPVNTKGQPTFQFGLDTEKWWAQQAPEVWARLFRTDPDGDLIISMMVLWLEKKSEDFTTVERGLEKFHAWLGDFLKSRAGKTAEVTETALAAVAAKNGVSVEELKALLAKSA